MKRTCGAHWPGRSRPSRTPAARRRVCRCTCASATSSSGTANGWTASPSRSPTSPRCGSRRSRCATARPGSGPCPNRRRWGSFSPTRRAGEPTRTRVGGRSTGCKTARGWAMAGRRCCTRTTASGSCGPGATRPRTSASWTWSSASGGRTPGCACCARARPVRNDADAVIGFVGAIEDFTDRKADEERLRASEKFLDRTGRIAGVGGWQVDLRTNVLHWTAHTRRIHEVDDDFEPSVPLARDFYPPEARATLDEAMARAAGWLALGPGTAFCHRQGPGPVGARLRRGRARRRRARAAAGRVPGRHRVPAPPDRPAAGAGAADRDRAPRGGTGSPVEGAWRDAGRDGARGAPAAQQCLCRPRERRLGPARAARGVRLDPAAARADRAGPGAGQHRQHAGRRHPARASRPGGPAGCRCRHAAGRLDRGHAAGRAAAHPHRANDGHAHRHHGHEPDAPGLAQPVVQCAALRRARQSGRGARERLGRAAGVGHRGRQPGAGGRARGRLEAVRARLQGALGRWACTSCAG